MGCNSKLDVEPVDRVRAEKALLTSADVESALVGSYSALSSNRLYGGYIQFIADLLGDNGDIAFVGTFTQPREFIQKTILVNNTFAAAGEAVSLVVQAIEVNLTVKVALSDSSSGNVLQNVTLPKSPIDEQINSDAFLRAHN